MSDKKKQATNSVPDGLESPHVFQQAGATASSKTFYSTDSFSMTTPPNN